MSIFSIMDWRHKVERVQVTKGDVDQTSGTPIAPVESVVEIKAHIEFAPLDRDLITPNGIIPKGEAVIATSDFLVKGDFVRIWHETPPATNTEMLVADYLTPHNVLGRITGIERHHFRLVRRGAK